jgi:cobalt-precorrin-5B (C1)-methyltransferase
LARLWVIGHPGKLAKILDGVWDTHSHRSGSAVAPIHRIACAVPECGDFLVRIEQSKTVEGVIELLAPEKFASRFWTVVEQQIAAPVSWRLSRVEQVAVRLFQMDGKALGGLQ